MPEKQARPISKASTSLELSLMSQPEPNQTTGINSLKSSLIMLAFGLSILGVLVAIGQEDWFRLRPVSTGAAAMWHAADRAPAAKTN